MTKEPFNITTSRELFDICQTVIQIKESMEQMYINLNAISMESLPPSFIPSDELYRILAGFTAMFDKCLIDELIKSGTQIRYRNTIH